MNTIGTCGQPFRLKTSYCCFWLRLQFHKRDEHGRLTMGSTSIWMLQQFGNGSKAKANCRFESNYEQKVVPNVLTSSKNV